MADVARMNDYRYFKCPYCGGTGEIGGMGFYNCARCPAAMERTELEKFVQQLGPMTQNDLVWAVHQRAWWQARQHFKAMQQDKDDNNDNKE